VLYFYAVFERPELALTADDNQNIDMENLDYKRQPEPAAVQEALEAEGGSVLRIWRGGMFGLATNQISMPVLRWKTGSKLSRPESFP